MCVQIQCLELWEMAASNASPSPLALVRLLQKGDWSSCLFCQVNTLLVLMIRVA